MVATYQVKIQGLQKLMAKLEAATREDVIKTSLDDAGYKLIRWSKDKRLTGPRPQFLGVDTGALKASISASETLKRGNEYSNKIGTNKVYAPIHEFGGFAGRGRKTFIPARPFLRPAIEEKDNQRMILDILTRNINEALEK